MKSKFRPVPSLVDELKCPREALLMALTAAFDPQKPCYVRHLLPEEAKRYKLRMPAYEVRQAGLDKSFLVGGCSDSFDMLRPEANSALLRGTNGQSLYRNARQRRTG